MHPKSRPPSRALAVRLLLLFAVAAFSLRFAYLAAAPRRACLTPDLCFYSTAAGSGGDTVTFYSAAFSALIADGYLSPVSKSLAVGSPIRHVALALKKLGVSDVTAGKLNSFRNSTFDFVFTGEGSIERSQRSSDLAREITRVLKPHGFLAIHTISARDEYSLHSVLDLFPGCRMIQSREVNGRVSSVRIRELLLQKEEGSDILRPEETRKSSVPEHKLKLVSLAEPLIEEEPLKPWITLKKNLVNIKYLTSLVDISFKNRYIYVDVGARSYGSSIGSWFKKQYPKQNRTFEIYAIEADKAFHAEYNVKKGVNLLPYAAWVRNETLEFEVNHDLDLTHEETGRGMGRIRPAGGVRHGKLANDLHKIRGFDFAQWLKSTVSERDFVVMKMDVEGTEFDLIPRLFKTGAIFLIDELFLECHYNRWQKCCPGERSPKYQHTYGQCLEVFNSLRKNGVLVHQWW